MYVYEVPTWRGSFGYLGAGGSLQAAFKKGYLRNAPRI